MGENVEISGVIGQRILEEMLASVLVLKIK
jgi:hypothetical protein